MRTCPRCGCYVPDKWINCPACDSRVKIGKEALSPYPYYNATSETLYNNVYQVKTHYKDGTVTNDIFTMREHALKRAEKTLDQFWFCVESIEVFDCDAKARIGLFYPNT